MARSIFQYLRSISTRRRIFRVYISPIIEWYLPVIMTKHKTAGSKANVIESFQHQMLALVSGACTKTNAADLAKIMVETPVDIKLGKLCSRHRKRLVRNEYKLMNGAQPCSTRVTRNNRTTGQNWDRPWTGIDTRDFGIHVQGLSQF